MGFIVILYCLVRIRLFSSKHPVWHQHSFIYVLHREIRYSVYSADTQFPVGFNYILIYRNISYVVGKWRVFAVTKKMNQKEVDGEKESIEKRKKIFQLRALFDMKHIIYALKSNIYYHMYKISLYIRIL